MALLYSQLAHATGFNNVSDGLRMHKGKKTSHTPLHADMFNLMEPHAEPEKVKLRINQWNDVYTSRSHANPSPPLVPGN